MGTNISINRENKNIEFSLSFFVDFCNKKPASKSTPRNPGYLYDLIGSFSERLIKSLERRMTACQQNLMRHLNDIEYADECGHIVYRRKDGSTGNFNTRSFECMKSAVSILRESRFKEFTLNKGAVEQTLKALLNDTEHDHSDEGIFKWSDLVSTLIELAMAPTPGSDFDIDSKRVF